MFFHLKKKLWSSYEKKKPQYEGEDEKHIAFFFFFGLMYFVGKNFV